MYQDSTRRTLTILVWVLAAVLVIVGVGAIALTLRQQDAPVPTLPPVTTAPTTAPTTEPTTAPTTEPTTVPTTEPQPEVFTLSFVGDCTFGNRKERSDADTFIAMVGKQYDYPFSKVLDYFANDECTFINLEGPLTDGGSATDKKFVFKGPTDYVNILTQNSVEAVTIANNHTMDYGQTGYASTVETLNNAGIPFVDRDASCIFTTEHDLTIGLYGAVYYLLDEAAITEGISALKEQGCDLVIFAPHWGVEGTYHPTADQIRLGHAAIDAGADIVWGSHPHVLQPVESYNGGIIYYSLGNFSFGGNGYPRDYDTALLQQEVIRAADGTLRLGELTMVPANVSSVSDRNNYQPTPYEIGTDGYDRVLRKLDGSWDGPNLPIQ